VEVLVGTALALVLSGVFAGLGGGGRGGSATAFLLDGEGGVEGSVLGDGVVGLALSVNGLFNGLEEEAGLLVLLLGTGGVGLAVEVSLDNDVLAGGVQSPDGGHGLLDVDSPGGEVALDLDGGDNSAGELNFHGTGQVLLQFGGNGSFLAILDHRAIPAEFEILVDFDSLERFGLDVDGAVSDGGDDLDVFELKSGVLLGDFGDSCHNTATDLVSVLLSAFPSEVSRHKTGQEAHANKASDGLHD
jgi:hypothetical protein